MVDRFCRDPEMLYCLARPLGPAATSPGPRKEDVALMKDNCATIRGRLDLHHRDSPGRAASPSRRVRNVHPRIARGPRRQRPAAPKYDCLDSLAWLRHGCRLTGYDLTGGPGAIDLPRPAVVGKVMITLPMSTC